MSLTCGQCSEKVSSYRGPSLEGKWRCKTCISHEKLQDLIETFTEEECDELYKMLKTQLEEKKEVVAEPLVEEEEPELIYDTVKDMKVNELTGTYYQTYGGGPEGGYYKTNERWYRLHRTWYQPWTVTLSQDMKVLYNMGDFISPLAISPA
jgi:hypothetical protein